jgi:uncharacterized protein (UPF0332 family)
VIDRPPAVLFIEKAHRALATAKSLLTAGDDDGACNRAYYAMFDAAHAALFALDIEGLHAPIKTHNGLVAKFGQHLVLSGRLAAEHGEAINIVQTYRLIADYSGDLIERAKAVWSVERADLFVQAVKAEFF